MKSFVTKRIPHSHFFRYLPVTSYLENSDIKKKTITDFHHLIQFLINYNCVSAKHQISVLYNLLESKNKPEELRELYLCSGENMHGNYR